MSVTGISYKAYDATLDKLVTVTIDKIRREICISKDGGWGIGGKECWPYVHSSLSTFELLLRERRVPYVIRAPEFVALLLSTYIVWEPAGVKVAEVYYDNRGFLRDPKGRMVEIRGGDVAARERISAVDLVLCLGYVMERSDKVSIECVAPPYEAARAMWALERAKLCVAEKQDVDSLIDTIKRYEAEISACRSELEELRKVKR